MAADSKVLEEIIDSVGSVLLGKREQVKLSLCCLLAQGHLLLEDLPGMGKTTFAHALALTLGFDYKRIQFTSDMLPADILGANVFDAREQRFHLHQGPVFTQILLADEINRSSPKTQSALLEAMEEGQVSIDGHSVKLPQPFFVIATQNPQFQSGTYALPESQLDRFLMQLSLGFPSRDVERQLLQGVSPRDQMQRLKTVVTLDTWQALQQQVKQVKATDSVLDYIQRLVDFTRHSGAFQWGLSPRAVLGLAQAARAHALVANRNHLLPEDVQAVWSAVAGHRLGYQTLRPEAQAAWVLQQVSVV